MAYKIQGGFKQVLARAKRKRDEEEMLEQEQPSKLVSEFIGQWSWGFMSAPLLQRLAEAAVADGLTQPQLVKMSKMGGSGKFPGNMHRDLSLIAGEATAMMQDTISMIPVRLTTKVQGVSSDVDLQFLLPHKLFATMYHFFPEAFLSSVLGGDENNCARFWSAMRNHPNLLRRPQLQARPDLRKVVPIAIHGDGVAYMRVKAAGGKSLEVLSWSSLLSKGATRMTSYLMFLVVKAVVKDSGMNQTWPKVWKVLCWSLQALAAGTWPLLDWEGEEFPEATVDFQNKGTPLAEGWAAVVFVLRSDLDFLASHFGLNSPASNNPCCLCQANRDMSSRPWTDCRLQAAWRRSCWTPEEWAAVNPLGHPLLMMPGSGLDIVFPDLMHLKHLGTDQLLLGGVLTWLIKHFLRGTVAQNLEMVFHLIQAWYKDD